MDPARLRQHPTRILPRTHHPMGLQWLVSAMFVGLSASGAGCSWKDSRGTHYLVLGVGFGVITHTNTAGVEVIDSRLLGAHASPYASGVGWMQHHRVMIDPALASNVVISIGATPWSMTVSNFDPHLSLFKQSPFTNKTKLKP